MVFSKDVDSYAAKVTDFGYSFQFTSENDSISMPKSEHWTAPEWHHQKILPREARKMDMYSFGMLCLWLLFYNKSSTTDRDFKKDLKDLENSRAKIVDHASGLVEATAYLKNRDRENIQIVLRLTLNQDPAERASNFSEILPLLSYI